MADEQTEQEGTPDVSEQPQEGSGGSGAQSSGRPRAQTDSDALQQAKSDALSPDQKFENYKDDLERLHKESVVDSLGHTPRAG